MLCLACEYRRSEGSAGLTGYILWPAAVPWTGGSLSVSSLLTGRCAVVKSVRPCVRRRSAAAGQYPYQYAAFSIPTTVQTVTAAAGVQ